MAAGPADAVDRRAVIGRIDRVTDPELDRSIVDLEYVDEVDVDGPHVTVRFVLPTAWCSPVFAWMMATGIRDEVGALAGVDDVTVELRDHMHGAEITAGVNDGRAFEAVFEDAEDGVEEVRRALDEKARLARQYRAVGALEDAGLDADQIVGLTPADLDVDGDRVSTYLRGETFGVTLPADPVLAYLEKARATDVVTSPDDRLFADAEGDSIAPADLDAVQRRCRLATVNMTGQGGICAQLHEARHGVTVDGD